jgi:hypothetical protein
MFKRKTKKDEEPTAAPVSARGSEPALSIKLNELEILDTLGTNCCRVPHSECAGTGTFGRVRLCRHKETGKYWALKILKKNEVIRLKQVEHIMSEKAILAQINHPFIVRLYSNSLSFS